MYVKTIYNNKHVCNIVHFNAPIWISLDMLQVFKNVFNVNLYSSNQVSIYSKSLANVTWLSSIVPFKGLLRVFSVLKEDMIST